ncbi:MAG: hypothetical protein COU27_00735 [Candidatus Levybacteria bacterium CG10_big_fil_rev_8_21_14_0_10_36_7]|nr:MAG: hypothetical protein COU27_00735 [Candidatus Levybacteria bacterium CG10_big_fil_rev_8_21_14_0_10_36_7]
MQLKDLSEEQTFMQILQTIATAYQEISVMKMREARGYIDHARLFVNMLKDVFESLRYSQKVLHNLEGNFEGKKPLAKILITANTKFHGDILHKIIDSFMKEQDDKGDTFLIGRIGRELLNEYQQTKNIKLYNIPDVNIKMSVLQPLIKELLGYRRIIVYYAKFKSIIEQDPVVTEISNINKLLDEEPQAEKELREKKTVPIYMFEPSGEVIASFLNDNVVISLVRQSILETQLARYASRIKAMNSLLAKVDDNLDKLKKIERKLKRFQSDKKQTERISAMLYINQSA